jgi:hypothetical protein
VAHIVWSKIDREKMAGKLRTQDYECSDCGLRDSYLVELPHGVESGIDACPDTVPCSACGAAADKRFSAPNLMQRAFPDGVDRGDAWKITKEAAKLRAESNKKNYKKRGEEAKEIRNLEKRAMTAPKKFVE